MQVKAKVRTKMSDSQASALDNCAVNGRLEGAWVHGPLGIHICVSMETWKWVSLNAQTIWDQLAAFSLRKYSTRYYGEFYQKSPDSCSWMFIFKQILGRRVGKFSLLICHTPYCQNADVDILCRWATLWLMRPIVVRPQNRGTEPWFSSCEWNLRKKGVSFRF